ncbi:hypothetical protein [Megasphaera sueciensis]|uniref:hypothetical protein n=1 Tax=Megasphaera sueciensis TaxID=349094 RepID=UPI003CFC5D63
MWILSQDKRFFTDSKKPIFFSLEHIGSSPEWSIYAINSYDSLMHQSTGITLGTYELAEAELVFEKLQESIRTLGDTAQFEMPRKDGE